MRFAKDYVGVDYHNEGHSHIDALLPRRLRRPLLRRHSRSSRSRQQGAAAGTIDILRDGLVGRGVLLDVPRLRGIPWLEPGEYVSTADLESAEREQGVRVGPGDILLVRTGHARRRAELPPWDTANAKAGLHPATATFLAERRVAALGSDGNNDTAPSTTEGVGFPIHVLAINAMGIHLLDYLQFEDLAQHVRAGAALGVPVHRGAAATYARDGLSAEPDRDLLRCSTSGPTAPRARWRTPARSSSAAASHVTCRSHRPCATGTRF